MNSSELYKAVMAAPWTAILVSSFLAPCTTAVRISLDRAARISGSYIVRPANLYTDPTNLDFCLELTMTSQMKPNVTKVDTLS